MKRSTLIIVLALAASTVHAVPRVGEMAPDFTLVSLDGGFFTLSDYRGKVVLINFFGYD